MTSRTVAAVVLAAGRGERLRSEQPKVLHRVGGRPLVSWVVQAARDVGCAPIIVVTGSGADEVRSVLESEDGGTDDIVWVEQPEQRGTGHALSMARESLRSEGLALVLSGDAPLVRPGTLRALLEAAGAGWGSVAVVDDDTLALRTVDAGHYALPVPEIFDRLAKVDTGNARSEFHLTDAVSAAAREQPVATVRVEDASEVLGVKSRADLAAVQRVFYRRSVDALLAAGVTVLDPESVWIDAGVTVGADSILHPNVTLLGASSVGSGCTVHAGAWIRDSVLGDGVEVLPYSVLDGARVAADCTIGPFARLRPEAVLEDGAKVGNFVEVKKATLGPGVKASHLAYLGDASVGAGANIGAGVITCNYDGKKKSRTVIGEGAFVGSDCILVAPVEVGAGAYTGAGSVITKDVPDESLAVGRARQKNLKRRPR
ncbi:MAG: NTP transferase domain-containing protein [Acidobacteriota bacterium]|nr:NTP transferase domain-containing protein [Acidobacteriota bacterium]